MDHVESGGRGLRSMDVVVTPLSDSKFEAVENGFRFLFESDCPGFCADLRWDSRRGYRGPHFHAVALDTRDWNYDGRKRVSVFGIVLIHCNIR